MALIGADIVTIGLSKSTPWINMLAWGIAGLSALPGFAHLAFYPDKYMDNRFTIVPWALGGAAFITGATCFALRIPERFSKGTFDFVGSSH